ncbi:ribbon-helix-helix domain-containing protein [Corynebacterium cystitidis]|uniref:ribbon-helix-helix domain-containing protein n=1 Tax=Corynebacterium cystitidis TaxID=35757 RepID=UPI00358DAE28
MPSTRPQSPWSWRATHPSRRCSFRPEQIEGLAARVRQRNISRSELIREAVL